MLMGGHLSRFADRERPCMNREELALEVSSTCEKLY